MAAGCSAKSELVLIVYTTGILIAIGLMGRSKVLDILFTKE